MSKIKSFFKSFCNHVKYYYKQLDLHFKYAINRYLLVIISVLITGLSLYARFSVSLYPTNDVEGIIFSWIRNIQEVGFKKFYTIDADYSYFLLFIYAIISIMPVSSTVTVGSQTFVATWIYMITGINFVNDILLAVGVGLIIYHITKNKLKGFIGYWIVMCLPVQLFDSAIWGNCDSLYVMLFAYTILLILKKKDGFAWLLFGSL